MDEPTLIIVAPSSIATL